MATITAEKVDFKAPADMLEEHLVGAPVLQSTPLIGTWLAADKATRGLVKVVIAAAGTGITVHPFGNCTPTPCDWGAVPGLPYATDVASPTAIAFSAIYKFAFKETIVVGRLDHGVLVVDTYDHFTDKSGRSNYNSTGFFYKS